jgi:hypothetical protein
MWKKRKLLKLLKKYGYQTDAISFQENGLNRLNFIGHLSAENFSEPFKLKIYRWEVFIFRKHIFFKPSDERLKQLVYWQHADMSRCIDYCISDNYIESENRVIERAGTLIVGDSAAGNFLKLTSDGDKLLGWWYCLNKGIKEYGEIKAIIITAIGSPLLIALIQLMYRLWINKNG